VPAARALLQRATLPLTLAPPRQPDATDRFRKIKAAYTTLSDPAARSQYDRRSQGACRWDEASFGLTL
jgi:DnaJ-class molecular chaperone